MAKDVNAGKVKRVRGSALNIATTGSVAVAEANVIVADKVADTGSLRHRCVPIPN